VSQVPSLPCTQIIKALQRDGWIVVRQRGSHIRLQKHLEGGFISQVTSGVAACYGVSRHAIAIGARQFNLK
jgi:hypothetical protein